MKFLFMKIALLVLFVLSLFLIYIRVYQSLNKTHYNLEKNETKKGTVCKKNEHNLTFKSIYYECNKTLDKQYKTVASEIEDYLRSLKRVKKEEDKIKDINLTVVKKEPIEEKKTLKKKALPKVVIIMDDICSMLQANLIKEIPLKITPSIFPPASNHPDTPQIAKKFHSYMVHVPMQAYHYLTPEIDTLNISDSAELIDKRIKNVKENFPDLKAINNHTGSMFTSDRKSMKNLFCALKKYNIRFVDSRTSTHTKAKIIANEYNVSILERNFFLDNKDDVDAILEKISQSIEYARHHNFAIAICHPKESTFKALLKAKKLFDSVEVVYIDELYR